MSRYEYGEGTIDAVMENPEEFIIPECLPACQILWSKNIPTRMCSNYNGETYFWIDFTLTSEENITLFQQLAAQDIHYSIDSGLPGYRDNTKGAMVYPAFRISSNLSGEDAIEELNRLASVFKIQDVSKNDYLTGQEFLEKFKRYKYDDPRAVYRADEYGRLILEFDPAKKDATLDDALIQTGKSELYVPEEDRIYINARAYEWHLRYLESLDMNLPR